jgi:hypothetical protein
LNNGEALMNKPLTEILGVKVSAVNSTHQFKVGEMHGISSEQDVPHH